MKINFDKCHYLAAGHRFEPILAKVGSDIIWEGNSVKLKSDKLLIVSLTFGNRSSILCATANKKIICYCYDHVILNFSSKSMSIKALFES